MAEFPVAGLRSVAFEVPDLAGAVAFYTETWGLAETKRTAGSAWLRATGRDPYVLSLHTADHPAIRAMTFRLAPDANAAAIAARAADHGATAARGDADRPGGGALTCFRDAQGRLFELVQGDTLVDPLPADPGRPERLAHVNVNSDDVARDTRFFTEVLGFGLTDRSKMMAFVRTNSDHHSVVIADATVNTLNHVAFQMPDWEGVMLGAGRMVDAGFPIGWGPGRHGPGNNVFAYFVDPFGFVVEYTADVLQVDERYRVGGPDDWTWPAGRTDQWGIAPPKTQACKAAQLAIPFA